MKIVKVQIQKIHIAKKQLNISDDSYREMLSLTFGVSSAKDLSFDQADELLNNLKLAGWKPVAAKKGKENNWGKKNYENLRGRNEEYAAPQTLRMIESIYKQITGLDPENGLAKFVKRITKIDRLEWLRQSDCSKVLKALSAWQISIEKKKQNQSVKSV
ncbi:MAG TPA: hypothetical protein DHV28_13660 [Ignavibacteriales bacterium]|nr:hypothetical protein [Ignavibacteriales bacterium]